MLDNALIALLVTQLNAAVAAGGWNYPVIQKQQPTQQGIPYAPSVFFEKLFDRHYGWAETDQQYNDVSGKFDEIEIQNVETSFQISAWVIQDSANLSLPTASDVVNFLKMYMTSRAMVANLMAQGLNVYRVSDVRNPYIEDDRHRNEATPSFDLVVTHQRTITSQVGAIDNCTEYGIFPV